MQYKSTRGATEALQALIGGYNRLAAGDTGSKSAHALRDLDGTGRGGDLVFVCKDDVPPFALPR